MPSTEGSTNKNIKIWKATNNSSAGMMITERDVFMIADKYNFVHAHKAGVNLIGKSVNIGTMSENQRHGGLFVRMNDFVQLIPQTVVTPIPNQIPFPPLGFATSIARDLPFFLAMLV